MNKRKDSFRKRTINQIQNESDIYRQSINIKQTYMNTFKRVGKFYSYGILYSAIVVIGYDRKLTKDMEYKETIWKMTEDLTKCLVWPVTAPIAVKNWVNDYNKNKHE